MTKKVYKYRNLPCTAGDWCVTGQDSSGGHYSGGILEWCYDRKDAKDRLNQMKQFPQFSELKITRPGE